MYPKKCLRCKKDFVCTGKCNYGEVSVCLCTDCFLLECVNIARKDKSAIDYLLLPIVRAGACEDNTGEELVKMFYLYLL